MPRQIKGRVGPEFMDNQDTKGLVRECSLLVGLHPDEVTDWIVDTAIAESKNFCVVPCCVFPSLFKRVDPASGTPVVTSQQLIAFLLQKKYPICIECGQPSGTVRNAFLSFVGRNQAVYGMVGCSCKSDSVVSESSFS